MHDDDQHNGEGCKQDARDQLEEKRLDPVVEFHEKPAVPVADTVVTELFSMGEVRRRLLRGWFWFVEACVRNDVRVIFLHHDRDLQVK